MANRRRWTTLPSFDDRLTRGLERVAHPADSSGVLERVNIRRARRARGRKTARALLAVAVVAATVAGFSVLTDLFDPAQRGVLAVTPFGAAGAIVTCGDETGGQICRIDADALARGATSDDFDQLTHFTDGLAVGSPSVSPDGTTVVFERQEPGAQTTQSDSVALWTIRTDGTGLRQRTFCCFTDPSWSTSGALITVASDGVSAESRPSALAIIDPNADPDHQVTKINLPGLVLPASPQWVPGGKRILFAARAGSTTDLYTVAIDGSDLTNITNSAETEDTPRLSPDGRSIAFMVGTPSGEEIRICPVDCSAPRTLTDSGGQPIYGGAPVWSPDSEWIASQVDRGSNTDYRVVRIDGSEERALVNSVGAMAWIPVAVGGSTPSPQLETEGRDIGLGFNLCQLERLGGIDFLADGTNGAAWIGVPTNADGTCPKYSRPGRYVVAEDHTGDGVADSWLDLPWQCYVDCVPFDATDLDANGTEELVVASYFSIMDYYVMRLQPNADGALEIRPLLVAEPGHEPVGLVAGEPLRIDAGGDEGYGSQIECEGYPDAPVLIWSWSNQPVETNLPREVHITRLQLRSDGLFHVVATNDYTVPAGQPSGIQQSTAPACGVDFHPNA